MQFIAPFVVKKGNRIAPVVVLVLVVSVLVVLLAQTASAQNTYIITDGSQVTVHTSYADDPDVVLMEAGIRLDENDFYTTQITDGSSEITLQRVQTVTVNYCGQTVQVDTFGEKVEDLLKGMDMYYGGEYRTSTSLNGMTYDGMEITIDRIVENQETYTVEVPFDVVYCYDDTLPKGAEQTIVEGVPGQTLCTADVSYKNGEETSRTIIEETVITEPVTKVIGWGTGVHVGEDRTQPLIGGGVIVLPSGEVLTYNKTGQFLATAYTQFDEGCNTTTATGTTVRRGVVAVDPSVIPYGTRMFIVSNDGAYVYGLSTAEDCGGGIQGNRIDLYWETLEGANVFGRRDCTVYFLGDANWN